MLAAVRTASKVWHKQEQQQEIGKARVVKYRSRNPAIKLYKLCYPQVFSIFIRETDSILTPVNKVHRALLVSQDDSKLKSETIFGYFFFHSTHSTQTALLFLLQRCRGGGCCTVFRLSPPTYILHIYPSESTTSPNPVPQWPRESVESRWKALNSRMKASNAQWSEEMKAQKFCLLTVFPHIISEETILFWIWKSKGHST